MRRKISIKFVRGDRVFQVLFFGGKKYSFFPSINIYFLFGFSQTNKKTTPTKIAANKN
jgi:hypothetical protein